jgi:hypothetical protein
VAEVADVLALALDPARSPEQRAASLSALSDYLQEADVLLALAEAARKEESALVRSAIIDLIALADPARVARHADLVETLLAFSALEPEPAIRLVATRCLAAFAPASTAARAVLAENLVCEFDVEIVRACLNGLLACPDKERPVIDRLVAYARSAPACLHAELLDAYGQLERADFEKALLELLNPLSEEAVRRRVLTLLGGLPELSPAVTGPLVDYLVAEQVPELRYQAVCVLSGGVMTTEEFLGSVLADVLATADDAALLSAFWDRLLSFPAFLHRLGLAFGATGSVSVKLKLLDLFAGTSDIALFAAALGDPNPMVRTGALQLVARRGREDAELASAVLVSRIPEEPSPHLRAGMIRVLGEIGPLGTAAQRFVVGWLSQETAPEGRRALASLLPDVAVSDENRSQVLRACLGVLTDPLLDDAVKARVAGRLDVFDYGQEPELALCLAALLERATDLAEVERLYARLRTVPVGPAPLVALIRKLFYRFVGSYPQAPLDAWVRDLAEAAATDGDLRRELSYLVRMTGAWWVLDKADEEGQKATVPALLLDAARKGPGFDASRVFAWAYEKRALRRSTAIKLFRRLVSYHDSYPLLDDLLRVFRQERVVSPEVLGWALGLLSRFPDAAVAYSLKEYLKEVAPSEPAWAGLIDAAFSPEAYMRFHLLHSPLDGKYVADPGWTEYTWQAPPELSAWPMAELFVSQASSEAVAAKLDLRPPDGTAATAAAGAYELRPSFHFVLLAHLNQLPVLDEALMEAVGRLLRDTAPGAASALFAGSYGRADLLHDRCLYVFEKHWPEFIRRLGGAPPPSALAELAAEVFAELCQRRRDLGAGTSLRDPAPPVGMDVDHLERVWALGPEEWDALWERLAGYLEGSNAGAAGGPPLLPVSRAYQVGTAPGLAQPPRFRPLADNADGALLGFVLGTPPGSGAQWPARWRRLLQAAQTRPGFARAVAALSENDRRRVDELLGP